MRRATFAAAVVLLAMAGRGHAKERAGSIVCQCRPDCWCKRPGLRLLRWVVPVGHRLR